MHVHGHGGCTGASVRHESTESDLEGSVNR